MPGFTCPLKKSFIVFENHDCALKNEVRYPAFYARNSRAMGGTNSKFIGRGWLLATFDGIMYISRHLEGPRVQREPVIFLQIHVIPIYNGPDSHVPVYGEVQYDQIHLRNAIYNRF